MLVRCVAQIDGRAARMSRSAFLACIDESRALSRAVQRYLVRRLYTAEQFVACNFAHDTTQRCARWILMLLGAQDERFATHLVDTKNSAASSRRPASAAALRFS